MMIPKISEYNTFTQRVYNTDPLKRKKYKKGQLIPGTNYKILDISRNGTYGNKKQYGVPQSYAGDGSCTGKEWRGRLQPAYDCLCWD